MSEFHVKCPVNCIRRYPYSLERKPGRTQTQPHQGGYFTVYKAILRNRCCYGESIMRFFQRPTKHAKNQRKRPTKCRKKTQQLYRHGQKVMLLVNFFLLSHCTVDKDILPGNIMKLRVYVGQLSNKLDPKATDKHIEHA